VRFKSDSSNTQPKLESDAKRELEQPSSRWSWNLETSCERRLKGLGARSGEAETPVYRFPPTAASIKRFSSGSTFLRNSSLARSIVVASLANSGSSLRRSS
jgi:hypothetical protein